MKKITFILLMFFSTNLSAEDILNDVIGGSANNTGDVWQNNVTNVDISMHTAITFDLTWREQGNAENRDRIRIQYKIDPSPGDPWITVGSQNGNGSGSVSLTGLEGSVLRFRIRVRNDQNGETWYWEDILVTGTPIPLPVELLYFTTKIDDTSLTFKWATGSEINNDYFSIQESIDGLNYDDIEYIDGAGSSSTMIEYNVTTQVAKGIYYRLKQVDFDGTTSYSHILSVPRKGISKLIIGIFDLNYKPVSINHKGFIIIKYSDGSTKKVIQ